MKKRLLSLSAAAVMAFSVFAPPVSADSETATFQTTDPAAFQVTDSEAAYHEAEAQSYETPILRSETDSICGDKISIRITNIEKFSENVKFRIYVSGNKVKTYKADQLKNSGGKFSFTDNGMKYLKQNTKYTIKVTAVFPDGTTRSASLAEKTSKLNYITVYKGAKMYKLTDGKMKYVKTASSNMVCRGVLTDSKGTKIAGALKTEIKGEYMKITVPEKNGKNKNNEQLYKNKTYYIKNKTGDTFNRKSTVSVRNKVVNYAVKMSNIKNQKYELCGEYVGKDSTRSDCSGLTKLSYLTVNMYMEHIAEVQANNYGKVVYDNIKKTGRKNGVNTYKLIDSSSRVNYDDLEKGDLIFFLCSTNNQEVNPTYIPDGIGHVAMYIGDGKMVHFTRTYGLTNHPCRTEDLKSYEKNHLRVVRAVRIIY